MTYQEWADKLEAIASYLQSLFPECLIEKIEDPLRCQLFRKHIFRIEDHGHEIEHFFSLDYDYLHHNTPDEVIDLEVGAVICATGIDYFDPREASEYGYTRFQNVVNSIELERLHRLKIEIPIE